MTKRPVFKTAFLSQVTRTRAKVNWTFMLVIRLATLSLLLAAWTKAQGQFANERPLSIQGHVTPFEIEPEQTVSLELRLSLPEKYRAYSEQFKLRVIHPEGFKVQGFTISPQVEFFDEISKKKKMGVIKEAILTAPMEAPQNLQGAKEIRLGVTYQACTKTYCLLPIEEEVHLAAKFKTSAEPISETGFLSAKFSDIASRGLLITFVFVFLAGVLTSFTPCVFPMIPITIAVLGRNAHLRSKRQHILVTHVYIMGIAFTYALLGVLAASTGTLFGSYMSHPAVLGFMCLLFLAMALSMFGLYEIQAPAFIRNQMSHTKFQGVGGVFLQGIFTGIIASPCVGPVLVGVLAYVAQTQDLWLGFWFLFVFALGMGQLFLLLGLSSQFTKLLPKSGAWMEGVKTFFGLVILVPFYYYLSLLVPLRVFDALLGAGLVILGSTLGAFENVAKLNFWRKLKKGLCFTAIFVGSFYLAQALLDLRSRLPQQTQVTETHKAASELFQKYSPEKFAAAVAANKPIIIDMWAEWCAACIELERKTFTDPLFLELAGQFALFKFDATEEGPEFEELKKKYKVYGLPTVVFHSPDGEWLQDLTVNEFVDAKEFTRRMRAILAR